MWFTMTWSIVTSLTVFEMVTVFCVSCQTTSFNQELMTASILTPRSCGLLISTLTAGAIMLRCSTPTREMRPG